MRSNIASACIGILTIVLACYCVQAPSKTDLHTLSLGKGKRTNYRRMKTKGAVRKVGNRFVSVNKQFRYGQEVVTIFVNGLTMRLILQAPSTAHNNHGGFG